jgi:histidinol-phosphate aminotransferase
VSAQDARDAQAQAAREQTVLSLLREDLRGFAGYKSARSETLQGHIWLNANESPWANPADAAGAQRRYPQPQPDALRARLAEVYGMRAEQVLIGRGSDEAIDLLVRALCVAGRDAIAISPPVFGMYAVCARLQNAGIVEIPLRDAPAGGDAGWRPDLDALRETVLRGPADGATGDGGSVKIVFLCSPGNPTGEKIAMADIAAFAQSLRGRALVVVDEAYIEFALDSDDVEARSAATLLDVYENIAVLRTLSKLHALAGARIGCLIAAPALIDALRRCQAPYPVPAPCAALALDALAPAALAEAHSRAATVRSERDALYAALRTLPGVRRVYPGQGNFLLARFADAETAYRRLLAAGVVVRDMRAAPQLHDALRITIGAPEENRAVLSALNALEAAA